MQRFWYNCPVKFFRIESEFEDVLNPQNIQVFGESKPYTLEKGVLHRFLLPEYNNETDFSDNFTLYVNTTSGKVQIPCDVFIKEGKIKYITFISSQNIIGSLELFYFTTLVYKSNCIRFTDTIHSDVKQARVITKHNYNRQLFDFEPENAWFVTNLPIYEDGVYGMDAEISNERIGGNSTLQTKETHLDEVVSYEIGAYGNGDIINFIQANVTNTEFFLNGTKRTSIDKIEVDDNSIYGKVKLVNVKDDYGFNVTIDETQVFSDLDIVDINRMPADKSINTIDNIAISNNQISITFNKSFVIQNGKTARIYRNNILTYTKLSNDMISNSNVLIINDTDINSSDLVLDIAEYRVELDAGIVQSVFGRQNLAITDWTFEVADNTQTEDFITWIEGGKQDKVGNDNQASVTISTGSVFTSTQWQYFDGNNFVDATSGNAQNYIFSLNNGVNLFRNIAVGVGGVLFISNVLKYNKSVIPTLKSVVKLNSNSARFVWNNNGIDYGSGNTIFQLSTDNGLNWQNFYTDNQGSISSDNSIDITSSVLSSLPFNTSIKFRLSTSGNGLVDITSNTIDVIWQKTAKIYIPSNSIIKDTLGSCTYQLHVEDADFSGYVITQTDMGSNLKKISAAYSPYGLNITPTSLATVTKVNMVNIPIGIYSCSINLSVVKGLQPGGCDGSCLIGYSLTPDYYDSICEANAIYIEN